MTGNSSAYGFETLAIHAGAAPDPTTGARSTPIYQTTAYVFDDADHAASLFNLQTFGYIYSRISNPTVSVLEERVATLEGGRGAVATASGHAAQILALFPPDAAGRRLRRRAASSTAARSPSSRTPSRSSAGTARSSMPTTPRTSGRRSERTARRSSCESLANPGGVVSDLEAYRRGRARAGVPLIVDNTLATPCLCRPFEWGADIVDPLHDEVPVRARPRDGRRGGRVRPLRLGRASVSSRSAEPEPAYHGLDFHETFGDLAFTVHGHAVGLRDLGAAMAPMNAFLTITGIETLPLRMERHVRNAQAVAEFLERHPQVAWVSYAGLPSSRYHELARKYLPHGAGAVFTFGVKGGYEAGLKVVEAAICCRTSPMSATRAA